MGAYVEAAEQFEFDREKFNELVVYIARHSEGDPTFGAVKLNKVLYYADFASFRMFHKPITGASYQKLREGPAPRELLAVRESLVKSGDAWIEQRDWFTGVQHRLCIDANRSPNVELFTPDEIELVDSTIEFFYGKTAREVSDFSHHEPGWRLAEQGETIPYETAWLSGDPIDSATEEIIRRMAAPWALASCAR